MDHGGDPPPSKTASSTSSTAVAFRYEVRRRLQLRGLLSAAVAVSRGLAANESCRKSFSMREDSGVIDLFAIHNRASGAPAPPSAVPPDVFSAPPPAFATDLGSEAASAPDLGDDDDANPFRKKSPKKLFLQDSFAARPRDTATAADSKPRN
jgi:hypothetical protein